MPVEEEITPYDLILLDLMFHPEKHEHKNAGEIASCCTIEGAVDLDLIDQHGKYIDMGTNGGVRCDVREGPCACGAWH